MLDIKRIRMNPEELKEGMLKRNRTDIDVDKLLALDEKRRAIMTEVEQLKAVRNSVSEQIPKLKKAGENADNLLAQMKDTSNKIKELDDTLRENELQLSEMLYAIPNIPAPEVPFGSDDSANTEISRVGEVTKMDFEPKAHWEIGTSLDVLDFERASKVTGARFTFYKGMGARLERAIINFFLDTHTKAGYSEIFPPFIANSASMTGTGQLPKFVEDMFHIENTDYYLIPTAEVPVTNLYRDEIIEMEQMPKRFCAYSACFRAEAGSAGRDTRGLIRQHQFNKVELVKYSLPENSMQELEDLTMDAQRVLKLLGLPFRVVMLCGGDLGASSLKTYDIEVWMPSYNRYVEISSCSNFGDYQARRMNLKFKRDKKSKAEFIHTLNGSGVAVGRTVAAIMENFQNEDGSVNVPEVLQKYMDCDIIQK